MMDGDPKAPGNSTINSVDDVSFLTIEVRRAVEGLQGGGHPSLHLGASIEFSEHSKYYPGDDIRHIDWRALARTDRYFIKSHEREVVLSCVILVDCSSSMAYRGTRCTYSKVDYAKVLAGALGHVLIKQGDALGLLAFSSKPIVYIPPERRPEHLSMIMGRLAQLQSEEAGTTDFSGAINMIANHLGQRAMVVLISDMWGADERTEIALSSLSARGHDVVLFHVLSPDEIDLPFKKNAQFVGMENEGAIYVSPSLVRNDYREAVQKERQGWRETTGRAGIDMVDVVTHTSAAAVLQEFALRRRRARRRRA